MRYPNRGELERAAWLTAAIIVLWAFGTNLAWSSTLLVLAIVFRDRINSILTSLSSALSQSTAVEIEIAGTKLKLTASEASSILQKIGDDVRMLVEGLSNDQKLLLAFIVQRPSVRSVAIGKEPLSFERKKPPTILHQDLGALRERHLVRPVGGGTWQPDKYPELTPFGELVAKSAPLAAVKVDQKGIDDYLLRAHGGAQ